MFDLVRSKEDREDELLQKLRRTAVINAAIASDRREFHRMSQIGGEPFRNFVYRLRAKASYCEFSVKFKTVEGGVVDLDYAEGMMVDQMVNGLYDEELQSEVKSTTNHITRYMFNYQSRKSYFHTLFLSSLEIELKSEIVIW